MKEFGSLKNLFKHQLFNKSCFVTFSILLFTLIFYWNSLFNGFVWDDIYIILQNETNKSLNNIAKLFLEADTVFKDEQTYYYRPLNRMTYLLEYALYDFNSFGYHFVNLFLHIFNVFLLIILTKKFFKSLYPVFIP